jgi:phage portal protein BeeE
MGTLTGVLPGSAGERMLAGLWPGASGPAPVPGTRERLGAFANTPWLHAVADKVASAFSAVEWRLYVARATPGGRAVRRHALQRAGFTDRAKMVKAMRDEGELTPVENHLLLDAIDAANPYQTGPAMRKTWMLHYDLAGDAFLMKERNGLGAPVGLWPLPPYWITRTPTPSQRSYRVGFRGWQGEIPDTEILWISNPDPVNPYGRGVGIAQALADEIETDEYSAKFTRQLFFNQARPDFLVFPKEGEGRMPWGEPARDRLEAEWRAEHGGFWRVAKPKFLTREVGVYEFDAANLRNLQMVPLREFERDVILQTWGMPPELMGILENSNRATISAAGFLFARWVLVPRLEAFRSAIQERLIPEYDERLIVDYASPVEDDAELGLEAAKVAPWALDTDEWRALMGHPPSEDPKVGKLHAMPLGTRYGQLDDEPPAPVAPFGQPAGGNGTAPKPAPRDFSRLSTDELLDLRRLVGKVEGDATP